MDATTPTSQHPLASRHVAETCRSRDGDDVIAITTTTMMIHQQGQRDCNGLVTKRLCVLVRVGDAGLTVVNVISSR